MFMQHLPRVQNLPSVTSVGRSKKNVNVPIGASKIRHPISMTPLYSRETYSYVSLCKVWFVAANLLRASGEIQNTGQVLLERSPEDDASLGIALYFFFALLVAYFSLDRGIHSSVR